MLTCAAHDFAPAGLPRRAWPGPFVSGMDRRRVCRSNARSDCVSLLRSHADPAPLARQPRHRRCRLGGNLRRHVQDHGHRRSRQRLRVPALRPQRTLEGRSRHLPRAAGRRGRLADRRDRPAPADLRFRRGRAFDRRARPRHGVHGGPDTRNRFPARARAPQKALRGRRAPGGLFRRPADLTDLTLAGSGR